MKIPHCSSCALYSFSGIAEICGKNDKPFDSPRAHKVLVMQYKLVLSTGQSNWKACGDLHCKVIYIPALQKLKSDSIMKLGRRVKRTTDTSRTPLRYGGFV